LASRVRTIRRWPTRISTIEAALEQGTPADVLTTALYTRFRSREDHTFGEKLLSAMRFGFGGHVEQH